MNLGVPGNTTSMPLRVPSGPSTPLIIDIFCYRLTEIGRALEQEITHCLRDVVVFGFFLRLGIEFVINETFKIPILLINVIHY